MALTLVAVPLAGAAAIAIAARQVSRGGSAGTAAIRRIALLAAVFALIAGGLAASVNTFDGLDGLSLSFILLTGAVWPPVIVAARHCDHRRPAVLYPLLLLLEAAFLGLFSTDDPFAFCWWLGSSSLLTFFLIAGWGGQNAEAAARKFLFFRLAGGTLILIGLVGLTNAADRMFESPGRPRVAATSSLRQMAHEIPRRAADELESHEYWGHARRWILTALFLGLAIETPVVPFHTWFAAAAADGPLCAALVLVGAGLRTGVYAALRFVTPVCGDLADRGPFWVALIVMGALYEGFVALAHGDSRRMIACASLSQAAIAAAAICSLQAAGLNGGLLLTLAGGAGFSALLFTIAFVENRTPYDASAAGEDLAQAAPQAAAVLLFAVLSLVGIPGLAGFAGFYGATAAVFDVSWSCAFAALAAGLIVAWTLLRTLERLVSGTARFDWFAATRARPETMQPEPPPAANDLGRLELFCLAPLLAGIFFLGILPQPVIDWVNMSIQVVSAAF